MLNILYVKFINVKYMLYFNVKTYMSNFKCYMSNFKKFIILKEIKFKIIQI